MALIEFVAQRFAQESIIITLGLQISAHWIVDFPLFSEEDGRLVTNHHPFTAPIEAHRQWLDDSARILDITGQHYDLVINGVEIGGGSIRIHDSKEQARVLEILGEQMEEMVCCSRTETPLGQPLYSLKPKISEPFTRSAVAWSSTTRRFRLGTGSLRGAADR
ncbi:unnamed protein product [Heligmosomoides polygyrus]|uniref:tRNA-synt_2 domain-containing protein n=1 Tax=Heligmosomoides polygyrus TaxID=6339 RepID=A0A183GLE6_HELPZ|nr:unnamed protein product [Heligmosomoides polygyrus]